MSAPVRPGMQAAVLECLRLQTAVAFPNPQNRASPGTEFSRKTRSPKSGEAFLDLEGTKGVPRNEGPK